MKYRHRVLGFLCMLAAITYLDRVAISVAGPRIQESLGICPQDSVPGTAMLRLLIPRN